MRFDENNSVESDTMWNKGETGVECVGSSEGRDYVNHQAVQSGGRSERCERRPP